MVQWVKCKPEFRDSEVIWEKLGMVAFVCNPSKGRGRQIPGAKWPVI